MGWFGVLENSKEEAFKELFSQKQYEKKFELLWEKHLSGKSKGVLLFLLIWKYHSVPV